MGQSRTALVLGIVPSEAIHDLLTLATAASAYPEHYGRAMSKWNTFATDVGKMFERTLPQPIIYLDEVERA